MATVTLLGSTSVIVTLAPSEVATIYSVNVATQTVTSSVLPAAMTKQMTSVLKSAVAKGADIDTWIFGALCSMNALTGTNALSFSTTGAPPTFNLVATNNDGGIPFQFVMGPAHSIDSLLTRFPLALQFSFSDVETQVRRGSPIFAAKVQGNNGTPIAIPYAKQGLFPDPAGPAFARTGAGVYTITCNYGLTPGDFIIIGSLMNSAGFMTVQQNGVNTAQMDIFTYNTAGVAADRDYSVLAFYNQ
jgi:hypothetical protein